MVQKVFARFSDAQVTGEEKRQHTIVCSGMFAMRENGSGMLKSPQTMINQEEKGVEIMERIAWLKGLCFSRIIEIIKSLEFV